MLTRATQKEVAQRRAWGEQLLDCRLLARLTQAELGTKLGIPERRISILERGVGRIRHGELAALVRAFPHLATSAPRARGPVVHGVPAGAFVPKKPTPEPEPVA